jgi:hypothetical protein
LDWRGLVGGLRQVWIVGAAYFGVMLHQEVRVFTVTAVPDDLFNRLYASNIIPRVQLVREEIYPDVYTDAELAEIRSIVESKASVVGVDVYRYGDYPTEKQIVIPHLFEKLYSETWHLIRQNFSFLFQQYGEVMDLSPEKHVPYRKHFIDTGDGGFQILQTPLHGILFMTTLAMLVRFYNSDRFMRKLHAKLGNIELRYAMTHDDVYTYNDKYYGAAIINNARILSKDALNRLLVDQNCIDWFLTAMLGIENLIIVGLNDLKSLPDFVSYDPSQIQGKQNALIPPDGESGAPEGVKAVHVQKIGQVRQKRSILEVHNVHIQAVVDYRIFQIAERVTVSLGNLNPMGIRDEA